MQLDDGEERRAGHVPGGGPGVWGQRRLCSGWDGPGEYLEAGGGRAAERGGGGKDWGAGERMSRRSRGSRQAGQRGRATIEGNTRVRGRGWAKRREEWGRVVARRGLGWEGREEAVAQQIWAQLLGSTSTCLGTPA